MSKTQMVHPERVDNEGVVNVPLNEWAKYRKSGYEFITNLNEEQKEKLERSLAARKERLAAEAEEKSQAAAAASEADPEAPLKTGAKAGSDKK